MSMDNQDADSSFIAEALPAFIGEAKEQIANLEQLLLRLEDSPGDRQLLDELFRAAHTIKGSAGIFGLDDIVAFTHHVESLLDHLREGNLVLTPDLSTLLLQCNDEVRHLVDIAESPREEDEVRQGVRADLVMRLQAISPDGAGHNAPSAAKAHAGAANAVASEDASGKTPRWYISAAFGADTFRNGMDPLAILHYLEGLGTIASLSCDVEAVPDLETIDPETCHLNLEFSLDTTATREAVEGAFSFVREDCALHVIEPPATPEHFAALIEALPQRPRLGDILVAVGAITPEQLRQGLRNQAKVAASQGDAPPLGKILQASAGVSSKVVNAALQKQRDSGMGEENRFIRVQADRLDAVINLLGELVIAGAGAALLARQTRHGALIEANQQIGNLIEEIRNGTLQLRMVPIGETFARFRRVVRDTAAELGKDVVLDIVGGETELDKSMVERIADPLMHLVRNALDHGLETPEQRLAAGKPGQGRLILAACHESGSILIRIVDDGRGIIREKVLQRAWERGLVEPGVVPPDNDILKLIFEPGFSTAEKVTNLSGRGVGMDVVRSNIEALRGSVTIHSDEGQGSRIEIRLPLTLAIIDGFLVGVGASKFIFPLESVVEVIETRPAASKVDARGRSVVELRGNALPVVSLRTLYMLDSPEPERSSIVVVSAGTYRYGVVVDHLLGQHQTVIKPLGRMFRSLRGMAGSSILGNGEVALIFDVNSLGGLASSESLSRQRGTESSTGNNVPAITISTEGS